MYSTDKSTRTIGLALTTAMAGVLLSGCASHAGPRADVSAVEAREAMAKGRHESAVGHAETAVLAEPRNAAYRAMLGQAYLDAGRFASAQTSFDDAMVLGDNSPRTALSLALALTAQAKYSEAAALLNDWETEIAKADLGLALALAGQPERGIHIMSNAIRGGENTVKMRQNLAYAYAVAGRWRDARIMVSQDLPADQVGDRMAQWGEMVHPGAFQHRIAALLHVPAGIRDSGQPMHLALGNFPTDTQLASEASAYTADAQMALAPVAPVSQTAAAPAAIERVAIPASGRELPPVGRPAIAVENYEAPSTARPTNVAQAFATPAPSGGSLAQVAGDALRFVQEPAVETTPVRYGATPAPRVSGRVSGSEATRSVASRAIAPRNHATDTHVSTPTEVAQHQSRSIASLTADPVGGSHLVQLGSFSSEQGARRAWGIYVSRYPGLAGRDMVITEAVVRGKRYFRVSAGGFGQAESRSMCVGVNANAGEGCIAWAANSPLPGAIDTGTRLARR